MGFTTFLYQRIYWKNKSESLDTPLGRTLLNRMDSAIYNIAENLNIVHEEFDTGKFDKADAGKVIVGMPAWNPSTGILTFRFYDGTQFSVDFNVEKIPVSFSMDSAGVITMTTSDGTEWTADIGDVVPDYVFQDSGRIAFSRKKNADGSYTVSADIKKGSITDEHLQSGYLASVTAQAGNAAASARQASDSADNADFDARLAQSYAVGGSGVRQGEDTDNAKKYKEACQAIYDDFQQAGNVTGVKGNKESKYRHGNVNITPEDIGALATDDVDAALSGSSENPVQNKVIHKTVSGINETLSQKLNAERIEIRPGDSYTFEDYMMGKVLLVFGAYAGGFAIYHGRLRDNGQPCELDCVCGGPGENVQVMCNSVTNYHVVIGNSANDVVNVIVI